MANKQLQFTGFGLANYLSFGSEGFLANNLGRINVFIGRNNSGKSNVLRALRCLVELGPAGTKRLDLDPLTESHHRELRPGIAEVVLRARDLIPDEGLRKVYESALGPLIRIKWDASTHEPIEFPRIDRELPNYLRELATALRGGRPPEKAIGEDEILRSAGRALVAHARNALCSGNGVIYLSNFRQIRNTKSGAPGDLENGENIIARLRDMQIPDRGEETQRAVFERLRRFVGRLIENDDLELQVPARTDEIIVEVNGSRYPLESYGTGLHQLILLCAAIAIHGDKIICIEEPEIHLHPQLQRRFMEFLVDSTENVFFIATHSNVLLDFTPDVHIYHVTHDGRCSTVTECNAPKEARVVLDDMGYRASDLLQSNGIIWVEGPSDRIYLKKWIELVDGDLTEGIHFSILFYGGPILSHFAATDDPVGDLVKVLQVNRKAHFIMDRDGDNEHVDLSANKTRIVDEAGIEGCWVTKGREIENYLPGALMSRFLSSRKRQVAVPDSLDPNTKLSGQIDALLVDAGLPPIHYDRQKPAMARAIADIMAPGDIDCLDLRAQIGNLIDRIRSWNGIEVASDPVA